VTGYKVQQYSWSLNAVRLANTFVRLIGRL